MKKLIFAVVLSFAVGVVQAQSDRLADSLGLVRLNQQIDDYVVSRNVKGLDSLYASDFVFSHGSGRVEGKSNWLVSVGRNDYPKRQHDSVKVELHGDIALLKGIMLIERKGKDKTDRYQLRYIRLYAIRQHRWQLVSHSTTFEQHF